MKREIPLLTQEDKNLYAMIAIACDRQLEPEFQEFIDLNWWDLLTEKKKKEYMKKAKKIVFKPNLPQSPAWIKFFWGNRELFTIDACNERAIKRLAELDKISGTNPTDTSC